MCYKINIINEYISYDDNVKHIINVFCLMRKRRSL
jgi:hypothetical protein